MDQLTPLRPATTLHGPSESDGPGYADMILSFNGFALRYYCNQDVRLSEYAAIIPHRGRIHPQLLST